LNRESVFRDVNTLTYQVFQGFPASQIVAAR
jgi:hypothetical protein